MSTLYENIDYMCKQNNTNLTKMCKALSISRSVFSELKSGRTKNLSSENKKIIASFFCVNIEYLDENIGETPCPLCGFQYAKNNPEEEKTHAYKHSKWLKAVKKFGFCWNYRYRESVKSKARNKIERGNLSSSETVKCYEDIYKALFSRALEASDYSSDNISFEDYVSGILAGKKNVPDENSETYKILVKKYGIKPGILSGTYFNASNILSLSHEELLDTCNSIEPALVEKHNGNIEAAYAEQKQLDDAQAHKDAHILLHTNPVNDNPLHPEPSNISDVIPQSDIRMIPLFESVSAGFGAAACDCVIDYIPTVIHNPYEAAETIAIRVSGDSMYPKIEDGDTIVVHKQSSVDSGQIAVVLIDGEDAVVKKVKYGSNWVDLISINPEFKTRHFEGEELNRLRILGLVRQIIKVV